MHVHGRTSERKAKTLQIIALSVFAVLVFSVGYYFGNTNETVIIFRNETMSERIVNFVPYNPVNEASYADASFSSIAVPAVDENGNGLTAVLTVQIMPGEGRVLTNIDRMLFWTDTQNSIRTSSKVASIITGVNLSNYDIIYNIETDAPSVEGPSAGTALTVATIAAIQKKKINPEVMITGTVNHDGTIGPVGQIMPKAKAARDIGARLLLVPIGQSQEVAYESRKYCEQIGSSQICTDEKVPVNIDIEKETGIDIVEVGSISEALKYFFSEDYND
jgi:uncharacterized protein